MEYWLALAACYVMGAIPFGLIIGKVTRGIDIRDFGSGNIGASNVLRTLGVGPAILVFFFDTAKGLAAVELCKWLGMNPYWVVAGGLLSVVGHNFSMFLKFQGGKGVATSLGVIAGLDPVIAAISFVTWCTLVLVTRYISIASIVTAVAVPVQMHFWRAREVNVPYQALAVVAALAIVVKHKSNIVRLMRGTENRVGSKVSVDRGGNGDEPSK